MSAAHEPSMDEILRSIRRIIRSDQDEAMRSEEDVIRAPKPLEPDDEIFKPAPKLDEEVIRPVKRKAVKAPVKKEAKSDDNLIMMDSHDQNKLRVLEKRLITMEQEYEQKLTLHREKVLDFRRQNHELITSIEDYKSKMKMLANNLKTAHQCLEQLQEKTKALYDNNKILKENTASLTITNQNLDDKNRSLGEANKTLKESNRSLQESNQNLQESNISLQDSNRALQDKGKALNTNNKSLTAKITELESNDNANRVLHTIQREFINLYHPERAQGDQLSKIVRHEIFNEFGEVLRGVRSRLDLE